MNVAALVYLTQGRESRPQPGPSHDYVSVAHEAEVNAAQLMAESFETIAGEVHQFQNSREFGEALKESNLKAHQEGFQPIAAAIAEHLGKARSEERGASDRWDPDKAEELLRDFAEGFRQVQ